MNYKLKARFLTIDQEEIDQVIRTRHLELPTTSSIQGSQRVIVSLTTYTKRLMRLRYTLYSLLMQTVRPERIVLWLSEEEFPLKEYELPCWLTEWEKYGVYVEWTKDNLRSYKKLVPALGRYRDYTIVTADDDIFYTSDWLEILLREHLNNEQDIVAHRARHLAFDPYGKISPYGDWGIVKSGNVSPWNVPTGAGGVLYPAGSLHYDVVRSDVFLSLIPSGDDLWFWAMAVRNGRKIRVPDNNLRELIYVDPAQQMDNNSLWEQNKKMNNRYMQRLLERYPEIGEKIWDSKRDIREAREKECIVYGAGTWGALARGCYPNILFYVDRAFDGKEGRLLDKKVYGTEVLRDHMNTPVVIAIERHEGITEYLQGLGMQDISLFHP